MNCDPRLGIISPTFDGGNADRGGGRNGLEQAYIELVRELGQTQRALREALAKLGRGAG